MRRVGYVQRLYRDAARSTEHKIVPVINGALGKIKKELDQKRQLLPGHRSATELQKVTLMSTARGIRKVPG